MLSCGKTIVSSTRFKNSGLKCFFSSSITLARIARYEFSELPSSVKPTGPPVMSFVPRLVVMMITVFLKSTTRPWPSVRRPSSRIWSSELKMSGCAFSISSNSTTLNGLRRTFSVSWPPSSNPTNPGGAPNSRETVCFSPYSLMSSEISAFSSSNRNSASALASSVFPTPVGPAKMNEPEGRFGSLSPARVRRIVLESTEMASS